MFEVFHGDTHRMSKKHTFAKGRGDVNTLANSSSTEIKITGDRKSCSRKGGGECFREGKMPGGDQIK